MNYLSVERGLAKNTLLAYRRDLDKYIDYLSQKGIKTAAQVNREHVSNFMFDLKKHDMSATTICRNLAAVKMFHRFLVRENLAKEDPTTLVDTPKLWKRIPSVLTAGGNRVDDRGGLGQKSPTGQGPGDIGDFLCQRAAGLGIVGFEDHQY